METKWYLEVLPGWYAPFRQTAAAIEPEIAAVVEESRDLMGRSNAYVLGYEEKIKIGPWYAAPGDEIYERMKWVLERGLVMDALRAFVLEVSADGTAVCREAYTEITGTKEGRIAFCFHFTGKKELGRFEKGRFHKQ